MKIPVITLQQPWAQFIMLGWKTIETRTHNKFKCLQGRRILIHASEKWDNKWFELASPYLNHEQLFSISALEKMKSSIICSAFVNDFDCLGPHDSKNALINCTSTQRYGLFLTKIKLIEPIRTKGAQGIWYY